MSIKVYDGRGRWRNKVIAFRMSPEEDVQLENAVKLSGLSKQEYIISKLLDREVVVVGNPRVYKALRNEINALTQELEQLGNLNDVNDDTAERLYDVLKIMEGLSKEKSPYPNG